MASPQMTAANASLRRSVCGGSRHSRQACARSRKRQPPNAIMTASHQPTWRTSAAISATPTRITTHTSSARPRADVTTPVTLNDLRGLGAGGWVMGLGFNDYNRRLMLPASLQIPAAAHPAHRRGDFLFRRLSRLPRRPRDLRVHPRGPAGQRRDGDRAHRLDDRRRAGRGRRRRPDSDRRVFRRRRAARRGDRRAGHQPDLGVARPRAERLDRDRSSRSPARSPRSRSSATSSSAPPRSAGRGR